MKERIDVLLVERGLCESREKAKALLMAGHVFVAGQRADKPGATFVPDVEIELRGSAAFVSRGGTKLEKGIQAFGITLNGLICADIGASTGGFTDCMLQHGAARVYAVDVGYGQLAWALRNDPRVVNLERTNARYLTAEQIPASLDFFSVDVSFISLSLILPAVAPLLTQNGAGLCLIKPQFEAGREKVGKNGVVREPATHIEVIERVLGYAAANGLFATGLTHSPIKGPKGNIEYLIYLRADEQIAELDIQAVVDAAHAGLLES